MISCCVASPIWDKETLVFQDAALNEALEKACDEGDSYEWRTYADSIARGYHAATGLWPVAYMETWEYYKAKRIKLIKRKAVSWE